MQLYLNKKEVELIYLLLRNQFASHISEEEAMQIFKIYLRMKQCEKLQNQTTKGKTKNDNSRISPK